MIVPLPAHHASPRNEHGFGIIEVIVAMLVLSIVVTGAVMASAGADRAETRSKSVADMNSIAERAFERAHGDLSARSACETAGPRWKAAAATAARSGATTAAAFGTCSVSYTDFRDEQGRSYVVGLTIQPVDSASDGLGANDADNNFRDDYRVSSRVALADSSKVGLETVEPLVVNGSLDWQEANSDFATVRIYACGINRPDRSLTVGGCAVTDASRAPLGGVSVSLTPAPTAGSSNTAQTRTITTSSNGVGDAVAQIEPGAYRLTAPATFTDTAGHKWVRFRVEPGGLNITGAGRYDVNVTYLRDTDRTVNFCTQIMTPPAVKDGVAHDDGFEAYSTNVNYRGMGSPAYRSVRIDARRDRGWACATVTVQPGTTDPSQPWLMRDPLDYDANRDPFIGQYDLEIEQNFGAYRSTNRYGMKVNAVSIDCSNGLAWNRPLDGTAIPTRARDAANDRPLATGEDAPWLGRFDLRDDVSHRICIRLEPKTFDRDTCTGPSDPNGAYPKGAPGAVPATAVQTGKCFYVRTDCVQYCPNGAHICTRNCDYQWKGSTGAMLQGQAAKPFGGPADPTVGCRPKQRGAYQWFGWSPGVIFEGQVGRGALESTWSGSQWVGGGDYYYNNYTGHYGSGPVYYCQDISFAASSQYLCRQGSNTPVYTGNGFYGCRFHYGDCIQAELPQYPGVYVRGIMRDVSTNYTKPIIPSIGALRQLTIKNGINKPETYTYWDSGTWWDNLDLRIRKVDGDWTCGDDGVEDTWPEYNDVPPTMVDLWDRIVDEPALVSPPSRPAVGNVGSDRVAI